MCDALFNLVPVVHLKNVKNTHGEVLILVKLQAEACEISVTIILIYRKLGSVGPVQQKVKLPSHQKCKKQPQGGVWTNEAHISEAATGDVL